MLSSVKVAGNLWKGMKIISFSLTPYSEASLVGFQNSPHLYAHSLALGANGLFYVSDEFNHRIIIVGGEGRITSTFGERGNGPGQFWYPRGLAFVDTPEGQVLAVCDSWNHRIQIFIPDGRFVRSFGSIGSGKDDFDEPVEVIAHNGSLWILDRCNNRIKKIAPTGETISILGMGMTPNSADIANDMTFPQLTKPGVPAGLKWGFNYPISFTMISPSEFAVADTGARRLIVMRDNGELLRILPLDAGAFPYFHPTRVAHLKDGVVLAASVSGNFLILDTSRPWIRADVTLSGIDMGCNPFPPAITVVTHPGNDDISLIIHDEKLNTILRYKVGGADFLEDAPPPLPSDAENQSVPGRWSHRDGGLWTACLLSDSGGKSLALSQMRGFFDTCLNVAKVSLTKLDETEGEICKIVAQIHELEHSDERSSDTLKSISLKHFECKQAIRKRVIFRKAFADSLSFAIRAVSANQGSNDVTALRDELISLLGNELTQRKRVCEDILLWARGNLEKTEAFHPAAFAHALTAFLFLLEHINLLCKILRLFGVEISSHQEAIPKYLREYIFSISAAGQDKFWFPAYDVYFVAGRLSEDIGFTDTAILAYRLGCLNDKRDKSRSLCRFLELGTTRLLDHRELGQYLANIASEPDVALTFADGAAKLGLRDVLATIIERFENASSDWVLISRWKELSRKLNVLENTRQLSISLSEGESAAEKIKRITGAELPNGSVLLYVKSIKVSHPDLVVSFNPCFARLTAQGSLLVSGHEGGLTLLDESGDCRVIWNEPELMISGMDITSPDEAIALIERRQPFKHVKIILINTTSGNYKEISPKNDTKMPSDPFRIVRAGRDHLIVSGPEISEKEFLWIVDKSFTIGNPLPAPPIGRIADLASYNGAIAITFNAANTAYKISSDRNIVQICSPAYSISPCGVAIGSDGIVFTTDQRGLGLQVFKHSDYLYQITELSCEWGRINLQYGTLSRLEGQFMNGNLLLSDFINGFIHIFRFEE